MGLMLNVPASIAGMRVIAFLGGWSRAARSVPLLIMVRYGRLIG